MINFINILNIGLIVQALCSEGCKASFAYLFNVSNENYLIINLNNRYLFSWMTKFYERCNKDTKITEYFKAMNSHVFITSFMSALGFIRKCDFT